MLFYSRLRDLFGGFAILAVFMLAFAAAPVQAQTSPTVEETAAPGSTTEIAVAPGARDTQISDRLRRILNASNWFSSLTVSVREGIVFLDGQTETDERREWEQ